MKGWKKWCFKQTNPCHMRFDLHKLCRCKKCSKESPMDRPKSGATMFWFAIQVWNSSATPFPYDRSIKHFTNCLCKNRQSFQPLRIPWTLTSAQSGQKKSASKSVTPKHSACAQTSHIPHWIRSYVGWLDFGGSTLPHTHRTRCVRTGNMSMRIYWF